MLPVCCVRGAVQGSGRVSHVLALGAFQPYPKRKFLFPSRKPLWGDVGEVAVGYIPSLWEGVMESLTWAEGNQHIWGLFLLSSGVYISYREKHVLQGEAQQNYKLIQYLDTQCENKAGGRSYKSCIRKGMGGQNSSYLLC